VCGLAGVCGADQGFDAGGLGGCPKLLPIGHPDIFDLRSVAHEVVSVTLLCVEPVDVEFVVSPDLFQVADRGGLHEGCVGGIAETPDRIDIIVLGERLR